IWTHASRRRCCGYAAKARKSLPPSWTRCARRPAEMAGAIDPMVSAIAAMVDRMTNNIVDHPVARQLKAEAERLQRGAEALDSVRRNRSPLDTKEAHTLKVA